MLRIAIAGLVLFCATAAHAAAIAPSTWATISDIYGTPTDHWTEGTIDYIEIEQRTLVGRSITTAEDFRVVMEFDLLDFTPDVDGTFFNAAVYKSIPEGVVTTETVEIYVYAGNGEIDASVGGTTGDYFAGEYLGDVTMTSPEVTGQAVVASLDISQAVLDAIAAEQRWLGVVLRPSDDSFQTNTTYWFANPVDHGDEGMGSLLALTAGNPFDDRPFVSSTVGAEGDVLVPEPATLALLSAGVLLAMRRRDDVLDRFNQR